MCKLCMKIFAISTIGEPALKSHASSKKKIKLLLGCLKGWNQSGIISREKTVAKEQKKNPLEEEKQSGELHCLQRTNQA